MAVNTAAARLTETHRAAQARLSARTYAEIQQLWELLDPADLDRTVDTWIRAVLAAVGTARGRSARFAAAYLTAFRAAEVGLSTWAPTLAAAAPDEAVATSLVVTGPVAIRSSLARGVPERTAIDRALASSTRAALRHALNGGRDTIVASLRSDPKAVGFARVTSSRPCAFCAMLASRGAVYLSEASAAFRCHDGCHCQPEPAYSLDAPPPPRAADYARLWTTATAGLSGQEAVAAFRAAYDAATAS